MKPNLLLTCLLTGAIYTAAADNLRQISSREGISNNAVQALAQDKHGFVWIGTCDGLNLWDGERMHLFPDDWQLAQGLSGNLIEEIAVTTDSLFWVRTNYGLDLFDPESRSVEPHPDFQGMYRFVARRSDEVLVLTQDDRTLRYDPRTRHFVAAPPIPHASYDSLLDLLLDESGYLWIISREGIFVVKTTFTADGIAYGKTDRIDLPSPPLYAFAEKGRVLFIDRQGVLYEFDTRSRRIAYKMELRDELARMGTVSHIASDGDDYLVSFLTNGVIRLRSTPQNSIKYVVEHIDIGCGVFSTLRDERQQIVWIGTDGQGLYQSTRNAVTFRSITYEALPYSLSKPVRALYVDRERALWVGTKGEGLLRIDDFYARRHFDAQNVRRYTASDSQLLDNSVYAFAPSRRNLFWIGGDGAGLNYYSFRERRIRTLAVPEPLRYTHALCETDPDTLWVATVGRGVFRLSIGGTDDRPEVVGMERLRFTDELEIKNFFFTLHADRDSTLWFGNRGGGAVHYDPRKGLARTVKFDHGRSVIANDIFAIHRGSDGDLWFGTSGGLLRIAGDTTLVAGIAGTVHGILEDSERHLWLSTNRGLVEYAPATGSVVTYGYSYGLNTIEYSDGAFFRDPATGTLLFGGINGLVTVDRTGFPEQHYAPPILFRDIRIDNDIRNIGNLLTDGCLTLDHGQRIFSVTVTALDFVNGSNYTYFSRIEGFNDEWAPTPARLTFADLPAGSYRLDVRYRNNVTGESSPVYSLPIRLRPAWYASTPARCLYLVLALLAAGATVRFYLRRYRRRREEKMQRLERRRKEEVYDSKMRFFANITQELSMPLTMISAPCQQILNYRKADSYVLNHAQTIRRNVTRLNDLIFLLHEFRGIRREEASGNIELVPVGEAAQGMVDTFADYAAQMSIHCSVEIERNLAWPTDREGLGTILNTLLSNAFKHTPFNGNVSLALRTVQGELQIAVRNDSEGVDPADIEAIFDRYRVLDYFERKSERGLSFQGDLRLAICHSIVERMQGRITVESTPNAQTTFTVRLPRLKVSAEAAPASSDHIVPVDKPAGLPVGTPRRDFAFDKNRQTLFIVDDRSEVMDFVAELFAADYNIKLAEGLEQMIELFRQMHPDLVICDALSERSECLAIIRFIKEGKLTSHIPVILLSTSRQVDERIKGVESGADICLTLPFDVEYLKAVAEQLLRRNRSLRDYYNSSISAFSLSDGRMLHQEDKEFIDRMLATINDNISNTDISTRFIADSLGVSIRNLYRRLEGILNQTPTSIIKELRLAKAEQLLTTTRLSIDEIIYKAGFVNRGTFFKCFAAKYGCTPKVYRKEKLSQIDAQVGGEPSPEPDAGSRSA